MMHTRRRLPLCLVLLLSFATAARSQPEASGTPYKGHDLPRLRGAMIGPSLTEADLRVLGGQWKANLIRWQLIWGGFPRSPADTAKLGAYETWLNSALDRLDAMLPLCNELGIKVVVDLHTPPGGRNPANNACRLFAIKEFQEAFMRFWEQMARRYRGNRVIWGYDLINIFEENGWDWSYHAFREWDGWSVEHGPDPNDNRPAATPTDRQRLLMSWYARNERAPRVSATPDGAAAKHLSQLYISGTMHIETNRLSWPNPDRLLAFFRRAVAAGRIAGQDHGMRLAVVPTAAADPNVEPEASAIRAVVITGVDWPGHVWKETAPAVREVLQKDRRFQVQIVEDPGFLASQELATFDVIVLHFKNYDPIPQQQKAQENLLRLVRQGKGLVVIHYASGALEDWPEYRNLVGRTQQKKHDKRGPFTVKIVNHDHPVTKGMKDFTADDELFIELKGERPIEVLATARSQFTGKDHPMAFVLQEGQGRVFHTTLGHDAKALRIPGTAQLIRRGAAWAAGRGLP